MFIRMSMRSPAIPMSSFFFFKQKTAYEITRRDWSSDVCSSDLRDRSPVNSSITKRNGVQDETEVERTRRTCRNQQPATGPKRNSGPFYVVIDSIPIEIFRYTCLRPTQAPGNIRRDFSRLRGELVSSLSQDPQHPDIVGKIC